MRKHRNGIKPKEDCSQETTKERRETKRITTPAMDKDKEKENERATLESSFGQTNNCQNKNLHQQNYCYPVLCT